MARQPGKRESKSEEKPTVPRPHVFKLRMNAEEMKLLRVAAAIEDKQPGIFIREIVLERAKKITDKFRAEKE